jgi:hypothetical protein
MCMCFVALVMMHTWSTTVVVVHVGFVTLVVTCIGSTIARQKHTTL